VNIYAQEGCKVRFLNRNGYEMDREKALDCELIEDEIYTVDHTDVGNWHTNVYLKEVPDIPFNSVMFEDVESESK
jgi:predicted nucleic-acid-binding protein